MILPNELTSEDISNIERFGKNYKLRVRMWQNTDGVYDASFNDYDNLTGIYDFGMWVWLKKITYTYVGSNDVHILEYEDTNGNWIVAQTNQNYGDVPSNTTFLLQSPLFVKRIRVSTYDKDDRYGTIEYPTLCIASTDQWIDVTNYILGNIYIERNTTSETDQIYLPHTQIELNNDNGMWNINVDGHIFDVYRLDYSTGETKQTTADLSTFKKRNTRITVEIKFLGEDWKDANWILISNFFAREWTDKSVKGEAGYIAKTKIETPVVEGEKINDIIEKYLIRNSDGLIIKFNKPETDNTISVINEFVGTTDLEPANPTKLFDGQKIWSHCEDEQFLYYAVRIETSPASITGVYAEIYRSSKDGNNPELVGKIFGIAPYRLRSGVTEYDFNTYSLGSETNLLGGTSYTRYIRDISQMAVDDEYLYIPITQTMHCLFGYPLPSKLNDISENFIYKLKKDGTGWESICGATQTENVIYDEGSHPSDYTMTYTDGQAKYSHGYHYTTNGGTFSDPYRCDFAFDRLFEGLTIYNDSGVDKLLVCERRRPISGSGAWTTFRLIAKDFSTDVDVNDGDTSKTITCILVYNEDVMFCHWHTFSDGKSYLGLLYRDVTTGDFTVNSFGYSELFDGRIRSLSFSGDGIYAGGDNYQNLGGYQTVDPNGIVKKYQNIFSVDGYNIIHAQHSENNKFISYPTPIIKVGGFEVAKEFVDYQSESLVGDIYDTIYWVLNLKTGQLIIKYIAPDETEIRASYDFKESIQFFSIDTESRLGSDSLGQLSLSSSDSYFVTPVGDIEELEGLQTQYISIKESNNNYRDIDEDLGELVSASTSGHLLAWSDGTGFFPEDLLTAIQFVAKNTGIISKIKIPIHLDAYGSKTIRYETLDIDIYITDNEVDFEWSPGISIPPDGNYTKILSGGTLYIDFDKLVAGGDETNYQWIEYDVSAADYEVTAGEKRAIILRISANGPYPPTGFDNWTYYALAKIVSDSNNICCINSIPNGNVFLGDPDPSGFGWQRYLDSSAIMMIVEIQKKKIELKSTDIIDSLNPNISSGFISNLGGSNSTISVNSEDYLTKYVRSVDFNISYSGGKFYIWPSKTTFSLDDIIVVRWYNSKLDLIHVKDTDRISESSGHGDQSYFPTVTVKGQRLKPADFSVAIDKSFEISPAVEEILTSENTLAREAEVSTIKNWTERGFQDVSQSSESNKFVFEFNDPFVIGSTGYTVDYGNHLSTDKIEAGSYTVPALSDTPAFFKFTITPFIDTDYHVMVREEDNLEWRIVTDSDRLDMIDNVIDTATGTKDPAWIGVDPGTPLKDTGEFYLKRMNGYYGRKNVQWIAYTSSDRKFYINEDGAVLHDDNYDISKSPISSAYPEKSIYVLVRPIDRVGNPLFEFHSESGEDGYDPNAHSSVKKWMCARVNRLSISANGINAIYSNFDEFTKFLNIIVVGFPINKLELIRHERRKPGSEHADSKEITIESQFLQSNQMAQRRANDLIDYWGEERAIIKRSKQYDPRIAPGSVVIITSEREGLSSQCFFVRQIIDRFQTGGLSSQLTSELSDILQI